jgi:hypothetical protein
MSHAWVTKSNARLRVRQLIQEISCCGAIRAPIARHATVLRTTHLELSRQRSHWSRAESSSTAQLSAMLEAKIGARPPPFNHGKTLACAAAPQTRAFCSGA